MTNRFQGRISSGGFSAGGGNEGIPNWNPLTQPDLLQTGTSKSYVIVGSPTLVPIDDISANVAIGRIVCYDENREGGGKWFVASKTDTENLYTTPSEVVDYAELIATFPVVFDYKGKYCKVLSTNTYWEPKLIGINWVWVDTGQGAIDGYSKVEADNLFAGKKDKITPITAATKGSASKTVTVQVNTQGDILSLVEQNIEIISSQVTDIAETIQDGVNTLLTATPTISKSYDDTAGTLSLSVIDGSLANQHISANAGIDTSKSKQATITPVLARPQNGNTQEQINNSTLGLIDNIQSQIETRPIGASNGSVYYLTSQNSAIANYELLSFSPDPSALDIESVTINSTTAKASRLIHSYIANYEIGSAIVNGGNWLFNFYGYVSHLNSSRFEIDVLKMSGTTETLLFTCETTDFSQIAQVSPALNIANVETTQQDFACNLTDKIVIKVYGKTDRSQDTTITLLHSGTDYASHIHTPLIPSHNTIAGTQGGSATEKYHLTLEKYNDVQALNTSLAGKVDKVTNKSLLADSEIARLLTMATGAEVNVNADWNATSGDGQILNKPTDILLYNTHTTDILSEGTNNKFVTLAGKTALATMAGGSSNGFAKFTGGVPTMQATIPNSDIANGIDAAKIGNASISNEEFYTLNGINTAKTIEARFAELSSKNQKVIYVDGATGSNTNDGLSPLTAVQTFTQASALAGGSGILIEQFPTQLTDSVTFTQPNLQVVGKTHRSNSGTTGTITANPSSGSQTYEKLSIGTFVKAGSNYVGMRDVTVITALNNTGTGALDVIDSDFSVTPLTFTGAGTSRFYNCRGGMPTVNNASALVFISNNESVAQPTLTAGTLALKNCVVYVSQGATLTLGATGTTLSIDNVKFRYPDNTDANINLPAGSMYSFSGNNSYKSTSTLSGTDLSAVNSNYIQHTRINTLILPNATASTLAYFDANKNLASLSTATYPSLAELSYVKGGRSAFQTQLDAKASDNTVVHLAGTETFTGAKTFGVAPIFSSLTASTKLELDASKNLISVAKDGSIPNSELVNSSITIAGTQTALGGSITLKTILGLNTTAGLLKYNADGTTSLAIGGTDFTLVNDARLGTKDILETNIGNDKVLAYKTASGKREYVDAVSLIPNATTSSDGLLSSTDKAKVNLLSGENSGDQDLSGLLTKEDNLNSVLNKQTSLNNLFNVSGSADNGKIPTVVDGNVILATASSGGNVSATSISGATGQLAIFKNDTGTELDKVSNLTLVQRQANARTLGLAASFTSIEVAALNNWVAGDRIYNSSINLNLVYTSAGTWVDAHARIGNYGRSVSNEGYGWLLCNGQEISRTTYAGAFIKLGTAFGSGDGATTFNIPDLKGRTSIDIGQGTQVYSVPFTSIASSGAGRAITIDSTQSLYNGSVVVFTTTGTAPTGLTSGNSYWVTVVNATTIKLSTSRANFHDGVYTVTSQGTGTHTFTLSLTNRALGDRIGEETHINTVLETAPHSHPVYGDLASGMGSGGTSDKTLINTDGASLNVYARDTNSTGSGQSHNNMQPSLADGSTYIFVGV